MLAAKDDAWTDIEVKFIEHFVLIVDAMHSQGLWDEEDGFFYDVFHAADGGDVPIKVRSIVGVLPLLGDGRPGPDLLGALGTLRKRFAGFLGYDDRRCRPRVAGRVVTVADGEALAVGVVPPGDGAPGPRPGLRRGRVPLPARAPRALEVPRGTPAVGRARRDGASPSTTSRPSPARACSAATPTGADRCGCRSTTSCCEPPALRPVARCVGRDRVPHRQRPDRSRCDVRRGPPAAAHLAVPQGADGRRPCHGWVEQAAGRPAVAGQRDVQRVLPRRQRRRTRRQPPDRLDRAWWPT